MLSVVNDEGAVADGRSMLDEICREGAQKMLAAALEAEADVYVAELLSERGDDGRRLVTRNGHARARTISTVAGAIEINQPRVNDRRVEPATGKKAKFTSALVPPWCRKSPEGHRGVAAALSARALDGGLRAGARGVLRLGGRTVCLGDHAAHGSVARRPPRLHVPRPH